MKRILVKNAIVLPMTGEDKILNQADILIENNLISKIGKFSISAPDSTEKIDARGMVAMPGLVNAHTHCAMTLFRGLADDIPLKKWLEEKIWPAEAKLTKEDVYRGSLLGIVEMLKGGITCFNDMYWHVEDTAEAVEQSGIRAVLNRVLVGIASNAEEDFKKAVLDIKKWQNKGSGRIKMVFGPHAIYSCPPEYLKKIIKKAEKLKTGLHIHLAETKLGQGEIKKAADIGLFKRPTIAAHCVWPSREEIKLLKKYNVAVVHCPVSNLKLSCGIAPVWKMLKQGITVALGTDGAASNNTLDMWQTMKLAALLAKVKSESPAALPAYKVLETATILGAQALGLEKEIGTLEPGKKADIILINFKKPHLSPLHSLVSQLVYAVSSGDVETTIINGRVLMKSRRLTHLNEDEIIQNINKSS